VPKNATRSVEMSDGTSSTISATNELGRVETFGPSIHAAFPR
jgi:hypothetical protein